MAGDAEQRGDVSVSALRGELVEGLRYVHARLGGNARQAGDAAAFVYGLIELLSERGVISVAELDERTKVIAARLHEQNRSLGLGVLLQETEEDKYTFADAVTIDCESRVHLCRAACCKLSRQDIEEGIVRWDLGQPYMIAHGSDGYCTHLDRGGCRCTVRDQRPLPCRAYDCRRNTSIWLDFDNRIINPDIERMEWPGPQAIDKTRDEQ
jgi:Fe-S-cluster containining protein